MSLKGCVVLVVANAQGAPMMRRPEAANPAFEEAECDAVEQWVRGGGSLLLITDHHPWGASNERLAQRLGVEMGKSTTFDPTNSENGAPGQLIYSRENGLIGDHPIMRGRDGSERIDRVQTFVGQSLKGPKTPSRCYCFPGRQSTCRAPPFRAATARPRGEHRAWPSSWVGARSSCSAKPACSPPRSTAPTRCESE